MKMETLLSKSEIQKMLLSHIADEDLLEVKAVTKTAEGMTVSFMDLLLTDAEIIELVKNSTDSTETLTKQSVIITSEGELGIAIEADLK